MARTRTGRTVTDDAVHELHRLAVVADDLTGAADAAAPFADRGAEVSVVLDGPPPRGTEVLALVTDGRWRAPGDAAARAASAVATARHWGASRLFVKVDSTLRGNVRAEVAGALAAWGPSPVVATPAFPAQGRVVADGRLHLHGDVQVREVATSFPDDVPVSDARDEADLLALARRAAAEGAVAVGSAGLARALAAVLAPGRAVPRRPHDVVGVLVVVGTTHAAGRAQADLLVRAGVPCRALTDGAVDGLTELAGRLAEGGRVLLTTPLPPADLDVDGPAAQDVADALGRAAVALLTAAPACALVVTGGSTALAVARALGASALRLLGEVSAGVALGELVGGARTVPTVLRSGGFGAPDALLRAVELLEECA